MTQITRNLFLGAPFLAALLLVGCGGSSGSLPSSTGGATGAIRSLSETGQTHNDLDILNSVSFGPSGSVAWWNDSRVTVSGTAISPPSGLTSPVIKGYFNGTVVGTSADGAWIGTVQADHTIHITKTFTGATIPAFSSKTGEAALTYSTGSTLTKLSILSAAGAETTIPLPSGVTSFSVTGVANGRLVGNTSDGTVLALSASSAVTLSRSAPGTTFAVVTPVDVDASGRVVGVGFVLAPTPHSVGLLWSATGELTVAPSGPFASTTFTGISSRGIVGDSSGDGDDQHVGIVYQNGVIVDANSLLPSGAADTISELLVISDDGRLIGLGAPKGSSTASSLVLALQAHS